MCPYVEDADARCGRYLTLENVTQALTRCACDYQQCPVYREIQIDAHGRTDPRCQPLPAAG